MAIYTNLEYYEAILQLRPFNQEVYDFVLSEIDKRNSVFITKAEKKKYGIDFRLTSSRFTEALGKKLKFKFGGALTKSRKIYGYSKGKGKVVYRLTICHRLDEKQV